LRIERHPAVLEEDLPGIYAHIARDSPAAADCLLNTVEEVFAQIAAQPEIGVLYPTRNPQMKDVRMLPASGNYLVFYRVESNSVRVLYFVHGARHLPRLFRREPRA
jgi:plasmid stabilization system protein ParE